MGAEVLDVVPGGLGLGIGSAPDLAPGARISQVAAGFEGGGGVLVDHGVVGEDVAGLLPVGAQVADLHADFVVRAGEGDVGAAFFDLADPFDLAFGEGEVGGGVGGGNVEGDAGGGGGVAGRCDLEDFDDGGGGTSWDGDGAAGQGEGEEGEEHFCCLWCLCGGGMCLV